MQKLLRGRTFYAVLGALILFLYLRTVVGGGLQPMDAERALQQTRPPDWMLGVPKTSELTHAALSHKPLGVLLGLLITMMAGMVVCGFVLSMRGLSSARRWSFWQFPSTPPLRWSFGELWRITSLAVAVALLLPFVRLALLASMPSWKLDSSVWIPVAMLVLDLFVIVSVLAFAAGKQSSPWAMLWHSRRRLKESVKTGLVSYVALFPWLILLLMIISEAARAFGFQPPLEPIHRLLFLEDRAAVLAVTVLLACVVGPIAEECFFRGVVYAAMRNSRSPMRLATLTSGMILISMGIYLIVVRLGGTPSSNMTGLLLVGVLGCLLAYLVAMRSRSPRLLAMLVSGGLFAATHTNLMGFLPIGVLGCLLAYLYERTGTLAASITVHIFHNSVLLAFAMTFRHLMSSG